MNPNIVDYPQFVQLSLLYGVSIYILAAFRYSPLFNIDFAQPVVSLHSR